MEIITGRIRSLLQDPSGEVNGFLFEDGVDIYFPAKYASRVLAVAGEGALAEVHGRLRGALAGALHLEAVFVINLESKCSVNLHTSPTSPEASTEICPPPDTVTPLAPAFRDNPETLPWLPEQGPLATRLNVVDEIERAYGVLYRTQTMLVYLKMIRQDHSDIAQYSDEAKHTYLQALSRYDARDFEGAREFAAASLSLSRMIEILISKVFHSSTPYPNLVLASCESTADKRDVETTQYELDRIRRILTRIHWVIENGTLPSEDRAQVEKLSSWSEALCGWAFRLLDASTADDAFEFARAADAAACSAEHLCKKCYVTQRADSQSIGAA